MGNFGHIADPGFLTSAYATNQKNFGLSSYLWRNFEPAAARNNPGYGGYVAERFLQGAGTSAGAGTTVWTVTQVTGGTATIGSAGTGYGMMLTIDPGDTTAAHGANVQYLNPALTPTPGMLIIMEFTVRAKANGTGPQLYLGLAAASTTAAISSSALQTSTDMIGFHSITANNIVLFGENNGSSRQNSSSAVYTLLNGTTTTDGSEWVSLGFRWKVGKKIELTANGARVPCSITPSTTYDPDTLMYPIISCKSGGTTQPTLDVLKWDLGWKYYTGN